MAIGVWMYADKITYFKEEFIGYDYIQSYEVKQTQMDIYKRAEEGEVFYIVCFYDGNCKYYVRGWDDLDGLKDLAEKYLYSVKNNL